MAEVLTHPLIYDATAHFGYRGDLCSIFPSTKCDAANNRSRMDGSAACLDNLTHSLLVYCFMVNKSYVAGEAIRSHF